MCSLVSQQSVEQEHTTRRMGMTPTAEWIHTVHDKQTGWKQKGQTNSLFIPIVDRGRRIYRDSHQKHLTGVGRRSTARLTSGLTRIRWQYSYMAEAIPVVRVLHVQVSHGTHGELAPTRM